MKTYGATQNEWLHFDIGLGLTSDLLPVVSNPNATISQRSTLKTLGKTPSLYNRKKEVIGVKSWTEKITNSPEIEKWAKNPDYGICIQTRQIRAIDVDVSDHAKSGGIRSYISNALGINLPCRSRGDSSKFLLVFEMPGEHTKQIIKLGNNDIIEFLANGQQFIAVGTHPSGDPYIWDKGLPYQIPVLTHDQFTKLWQSLSEQFQGELVSTRTRHKSRDISGNGVLKTDDIANFLDENWNVYSIGKSGERYIECPFSDDHTTESNETATAYFSASTGGFEQGHFRCLHAHCENKDDGEFLNAIGYRSQDFDVIPMLDNENPLPDFKRAKNGEIKATLNNVRMALRRPDICGIRIRYDQFRDEMLCAHFDSDEWRRFTDHDYTNLRSVLEFKDFQPIGRELIRDAVGAEANNNQCDSAIEWLEGITWDGVPRVNHFLSEYFNADVSDYTKAVSRYLWTALAGRVLKPGIKADMVPILVSTQGKLKSTVIGALAPSQDHFCNVSFTERDDNLARKMKGRLVAEIGELSGLHTRELEGIKSFITQTHETWIPKFKELSVTYPRRIIFIGTTNKDEFLDDETGNRRFLPVEVGMADLDAIIKYRDQLWAEGRALFLKHGILYQEAERLGAKEHGQYMLKDPWQDAVEEWLETPDMLTEEKPIDKAYLKTSEVLRGALGMEPKSIKRGDEMRMAKTLKAIGYERKLIRDGVLVLKAFVKKSTT